MRLHTVGRTEAELWSGVTARVTTRDDAEIEAFFARHYRSLRQTAYLLVHDAATADEIVMDAFASAILRWRHVRDTARPEAYVRRMVVNLSTSRVRRTIAERRAHTRMRSRAATPHPELGFSETFEDVAAAIARLAPRQRAVVVLRYFEDLSEADIARTLGCSVGTVKSQLAKSRAHLAASLAHLIDEET